MVFRGKIDAERRAYIKFLREDGGLTNFFNEQALKAYNWK